MPGECPCAPTGALVATVPEFRPRSRCGIFRERGDLFIGPAIQVYEGMILGENSRRQDMDVNVTKEKKQPNMRSSSADEAIRLIPHKELSLEQTINSSPTTNSWKSRTKSIPPPQKSPASQPSPRRGQEIRASQETR